MDRIFFRRRILFCFLLLHRVLLLQNRVLGVCSCFWLVNANFLHQSKSPQHTGGGGEFLEIIVYPLKYFLRNL
ncbi:hypothetical protein EDC94DRAFT_595182 [Helicostylum pulchrum]|nr:hypothetical protein EDC94DRAFT_595182 [Helicostylum pulchrum]